MKQAKTSPAAKTGKAIGRETAGPVALSPRQRQILTLLRDGKSNKEIAAELDIGVGTVKQHLVALFKKMRVGNRAAAISKSFSVDGLSIDGPVPLDTEAPAGEAASAWIERRPCAVLSLELITHVDGSELSRILYRVFAETAYDFGAVFLSHLGGRCDMIFGIRRVRRHDVLRAIRAAVAISEEVFARTGARQQVRAGLAHGYILASMDPRGEWTGETISGRVVSAARNVLASAEAGTVALHPSASAMISALRMGTDGGIPAWVDLDRDFRWRHLPPPTSVDPINLRAEIDVLRARLRQLSAGTGSSVLIEGESGMGKTTLAGKLIAMAGDQGYEAETWICATPDSQPGSASLGRIERAGSVETRGVSGLIDHLAGTDSPVVMIEDCHLLPRPEYERLASQAPVLAGSRLLVITYRGRAAAKLSRSVFSEALRLTHLPPEKSRDLLADLLGRDHPGATWITDMARGVPGFLVRLARLAGDARHWAGHGPGDMPPADLAAVVAERIEEHGIDRRLLHAAAKGNGTVGPSGLRRQWLGDDTSFEAALNHIVNSGVVRKRPGRRGKEDRYEVVHPIVRWVAASSFPPPGGMLD